MTTHASKKIASLRLSTLLLSIILLVACGPAQDTEQPRAGTRNVILFVGDGFGPAQTSLGVQYANLVENRELNIESLMLDGNTGFAQPIPFDSIVIDSAAAATQLATGQAVRNDTLGLNPDGYPIETILEWAHERGLGTGIVTNMRVTHATPAGFAVHQRSRYDSEQLLMDDLLQERDIDVLLGGGARALIPAGSQVSDTLPGIPKDLDGESIRDDAFNGINELAAEGYVIASDAQSLQAAANHATKLLGMFSASHLPYVIDRQQMNVPNIPTLAKMTSAALDVLSRHDEGFFLLVEGGRIDFGGHANDAGTLLHEILDFDEAVGKGLEYQSRHPETLVNLISEHTGLEMTMDEAREALRRGEDGLPGTERFRHFHGDAEDGAAALLGQALARHTYVTWSTGEHTSDPVPTYGRGPGAEKLRGIYPNTHIYSVMRDALERRK